MNGRAVQGLGRLSGMLAVVLGVALGGCSIPIADLPAIGLPAGAPPRPVEPGVYPTIHDVPAGRSEPMLDPAEQAKVERDLKMARNRQGQKTLGKTSGEAPAE